MELAFSSARNLLTLLFRSFNDKEISTKQIVISSFFIFHEDFIIFLKNKKYI